MNKSRKLALGPIALMLTGVALSLSGCGGGSVTEDSPPRPYVAMESAKYGSHIRNAADLYNVREGVKAKGLVIWIHGGGWSHGDKTEGQAQLFEPLLARGVAVLAINYQLLPSVYPSSVNDVQAVLAAVDGRACAECSNPDVWKQATAYAKNGFMVAGASAGGYLAVYGAGNYLLSNPVSNLKCVNNIVGPVDLREPLKLPKFSQDLVSGYSGGDLSATKMEEMSPQFHLEHKAWATVVPRVKWFLSVSEFDEIVPVERMATLEPALLKLGGKVVSELTHDAKDGGHSMSLDTFKKAVQNPAHDCFGLTN